MDKDGIRCKRYSSLLMGWLFSRRGVVILFLGVVMGAQSWLTGAKLMDGVIGVYLGMGLAAGLCTSVVAYLEYDSMPPRIWFEADVLYVEDVSGIICRFTRWAVIES